MKRLKPFSIVLVGVLALLAILFMTTKKNDYTSTLQKYAALIQAGASGDLCLKFPCCDIHKDIYGCSLRNMPKLPSTLVFPGGETRCIFSSSTPYSFQVWPGDSDRVLLNFQGGGLCWDKLSTSLQFCSTNTSPQTLEGVFDRQNKSNKFANYTIINIMYCSGDMFIGDVERDYSDPDGNPVVQKGHANTLAVFEWIREQQRTGDLDKVFSSLIIMGQSAGSLGAKLYCRKIFSEFEYKAAAVITDSYLGVFPDGQESIMYDFGGCNSDILNLPMRALCLLRQLTMGSVVQKSMRDYPEVPFVYIQSKIDLYQTSYYSALAVTLDEDPLITESQFYLMSQNLLQAFNEHSNFVLYLADGSTHTFTTLNKYYTSGAEGEKKRSENYLSLQEHIEQFIQFPEVVSSVCKGVVLSKKEAVAAVAAEEEGGPSVSNDYCLEELFPKLVHLSGSSK